MLDLEPQVNKLTERVDGLEITIRGERGDNGLTSRIKRLELDLHVDDKTGELGLISKTRSIDKKVNRLTVLIIISIITGLIQVPWDKVSGLFKLVGLP